MKEKELCASGRKIFDFFLRGQNKAGAFFFLIYHWPYSSFSLCSIHKLREERENEGKQIFCGEFGHWERKCKSI